ncbi:hypothetical protein [Caulobacter sp.]|uniref:hypothetical protein n=1 Tax=Caulobacter sp. TaxID=78 RepID=UPI0031D85C19
MGLLSPLTELDAVNEMLMSIGQAPVNTLAVSGIRDVNIAKAELAKVNRFVQLYGFAFNTDDDYVLTPDINGRIGIPNGVLRIDPMDPRANIVQRRHPTAGLCLWDGANLTWTMDGPVAFSVTWGFDFADLPETARYFIAIAAARKFQKRIIGSTELDGYNKEDEEKAWAILIRDERRSRDTNSFRTNPQLRRAYNRSGRSGTRVTG